VLVFRLDLALRVLYSLPLDESDLDPRRHPITGSDFEPLLMSTFEDSNPALSTIAEDALESHESKDRKLSKRLLFDALLASNANRT